MLPAVAAFVFLIPSVTTAQAVGEIPSLPEEAVRLRREQLRLAMEAGVELSYSDIGQRSGSHLLQVPPEFRELQILDETDLEAILDELYPYYAFSGTESLVFEDKQTRDAEENFFFRQYIDQIETPMTLRIDVDTKTRRILRFLGVLVMDRDLDRSPATSEQEAIESARGYLRQLPEFDAARFLFDDNDSATRVYAPWGEDGLLTPVWRVALEKNSAIYPSAAPELLLVGPNGEVRPTGVLLNGTQEDDTQSQARAHP